MLKSQAGSFTFTPNEEIVAGQFVQFRLVYKAGDFGIDEIGGIQIALRLASDLTPFQFDDPQQPGYTKILAPEGNTITVSYDPAGGVRPWYKLLSLKLSEPLLPDEEIHVLYGSTSDGSPGVRMQTFCEKKFQFKCYADPFGTNSYIEVPCQQTLKVIPELPVSLRVFIPSRLKPQSTFKLKATAVDKWGNPSAVPKGTAKITSNFDIANLPKEIDITDPSLPLIIDNLSVDKLPAIAPQPALYIDIWHVDTNIAGKSNPCVISKTEPPVFWGDLHGQSEESVGTNSARDYFQFARDCACVDMVSHQANDFQITHAFWMHLNNLTENFEAPGFFLAIPGYEWSGNSHLGGDHNVYFRHETETIARAHKALITDKSLPFTDAPTIKTLFEKFNQDDTNAVVNAHVGGRFADLSQGHDSYRASVEIHSAWGTFEWILHQAFELEQRVGIVCCSDDHQGRPGASHPGTSLFGAPGGLTAYVMKKLNRDDLFDAMRNRHHYGTTGCRMLLEVKLQAENELVIVGKKEREDKIFTHQSATMGDIVETVDDKVQLSCRVVGTAPIHSVALFDGTDLVDTFIPYPQSEQSKRIRILWHGANCKSRKRMAIWNGQLSISDNSPREFRPINFHNPEKQPHLENEMTVQWESATAGGFAGLDLFLEKEGGKAAITTEQGSIEIDFSDNFSEKTHDFGGLGKKITVQRLPEQLTVSDLQCEFHLSTNLIRENKLYIKVIQEDGHVGWTSPIYLSRKDR